MKRRRALLASLIPTCVPAHPVDEVVQGAYLTLAPDAVRLELDITPGPLVSNALLRTLDTDADRRISDVEARAYGQRVLDRSTLWVNHLLTSEPIASRRLQNHVGRTLELHLANWPDMLPPLPTTLFRVTPAGVFESTAEGWGDTVHLFRGVTADRRRVDGREVIEAQFFARNALPLGTSPATLRRVAELDGAARSPVW